MKEFVAGRRKYKNRKQVVKFTRKKDERLRVLVNFCIGEVDRIRARESEKPCEVVQQDHGKGRYVVSKIRMVVSVKVAAVDSKRCSIAAKREAKDGQLEEKSL